MPLVGGGWIRDPVAEGYAGVGTEFTRDWAYMADRLNGNTLMTSSGDTQLTPCASALGSSVLA